MAAVPKKKHSHGRTTRRRSTFKASISALSKCPSCGKLKEPHKSCPSCGAYKS
ncbi:50S ribosomal protein L32 [Candidatus Microgenomates bacterium]|nr:50S ribosomal protein L32 [Candidatus Microgenomates bacterium]